jgi:hypothetical protein
MIWNAIAITLSAVGTVSALVLVLALLIAWRCHRLPGDRSCGTCNLR